MVRYQAPSVGGPSSEQKHSPRDPHLQTDPSRQLSGALERRVGIRRW